MVDLLREWRRLRQWPDASRQTLRFELRPVFHTCQPSTQDSRTLLPSISLGEILGRNWYLRLQHCRDRMYWFQVYDQLAVAGVSWDGPRLNTRIDQGLLDTKFTTPHGLAQ